MMIAMAPNAGADQIANVVAPMEATGTAHRKVVRGNTHDAVAAVGDAAGVRELGLELLAGVDQAVPIARRVLAHAALAGRRPAQA